MSVVALVADRDWLDDLGRGLLTDAALAALHDQAEHQMADAEQELARRLWRDCDVKVTTIPRLWPDPSPSERGQALVIGRRYRSGAPHWEQDEPVLELLTAWVEPGAVSVEPGW